MKISLSTRSPGLSPSSIHLPKPIRYLRNLTLAAIVVLFLGAIAINLHRYVTQVPLVRNSLSSIGLAVPEMVFCMNAQYYNVPAATSFLAGDANPVCFGEVLGKDATVGTPVPLSQYVAPFTFPQDGGNVMWDTNATIPCHRFSPLGRLRFSAYAPSSTSDPTKYISAISCGYDYDPSNRTKDDGNVWPPRLDRLTAAIFPREAPTSQLQFLPSEVLYNTSMSLFLQYQAAEKMGREPQTILQWSMGNSLAYYWVQSLTPYNQRTSHHSSIYVRISPSNLLTEANNPNLFQVPVSQEVRSITILDIFVTMGGVFSFLSTIFLILFGSRRLQPFGIVHKLFSIQLRTYLQSKYGKNTTLIETNLNSNAPPITVDVMPDTNAQTPKSHRSWSPSTKESPGDVVWKTYTLDEPAVCLEAQQPLPTDHDRLRAIENILEEFYIDTSTEFPRLSSLLPGSSNKPR
ncbi:uncharacterized protein SPPG_06447 [Spizellomyces punctatus DAOM BR117]|uniref:Uncharacterized protein n=1 Tax=Spizellomyces punctatus (strain DAOM BR117) TaxID=645134 RepID=A0A0L0HBC5_SPIPD|nr:uncharacterized protein SPPG_06447 [Spizellomyces punctatus DAOM BR117]KNC98028.1 hypothetical protein SPPG_06447 [Spizellomyces punctatus DAOM BR117]|eukprot:XP_016606068.1 hypothetical protein SPPG_06447 [Spizellomyces punctatus DAOM BR117]